MKTRFTYASNVAIFVFLNLLFCNTHAIAQVGINTTTPADGALLDISATNRGLLIPRVTLIGTNDVATITPSATIGLMIYNTVTAGALPVQVSPGFYYWDGTKWLRFFNNGYALKFDQTAEVNANTLSNVSVNLPGLDSGILSVPYSGTYQIKVEAQYACGNRGGTVDDGVGQASVSLNMSTNPHLLPTIVKETYVTSTSKRIGTQNQNNLAQNVTIIYNVDLNVLNTYRFFVQGREWSRNNVGTGAFGMNTATYSGSSPGNSAQRGTMTITLLKQF